MTAETNLSITSIAGLTNNPSQTITGTGAVGATVKVLDGTTLLGTTVVGSDGTWSEVVALSGQGMHSIRAQSVGSQPTLSTLVNFDGVNGEYPQQAGLLSDSSGNLYGTTGLGGAHGLGTVFKLSGENYQTITTLVSFDGNNGTIPSGSLVSDGAGNLYGVTGGLVGTVFQLSGTEHNVLTTLVRFDGSNGLYPRGTLAIDSDGNLYGATTGGGEQGLGTVFELSGANHESFTTLMSFDKTSGHTPLSGLASDLAGNLYGTTAFDGSNSNGTVFKLSGINHQIFTQLVTFDGSNGSRPSTTLVSDPSGNLYGTTFYGGLNGQGTVFELSGASHTTLTVLASFDATTGNYPRGALFIDQAGSLFGQTGEAGVNGYGSLFELSGANHQTLTTVVSFDLNNFSPCGSLIGDGYGNLYGTTQAGGPENKGTVFKLRLGTEQFSGINVDLDTIAPTITLLSQTSNNALATVAKAGDIIAQSFTSTDTVTSVLIDGQVAAVVRGSGNNYTATYTVQMGDINGTADVVITALDAAGNITIDTTVGSVMVDTVANVAITSSGRRTFQASQTITGTGEVGNTINVLEDSTLIGTATVGLDGIWSNQVTLFGSGAHSVTASATDSVGNSGISTDVVYTLDLPPTITSLGGLTNQTSQIMSGTGPAGSIVTVMDGTNVLGTAVVGADSSWSEIFTLSGQGAHSITAVSEGVAIAPKVTTLVMFDGNNGNGMSLITDTAGKIYGTTTSSVFEITGAEHQTFKTLATFNNYSSYDGRLFGDLALDASGDLYGTIKGGGRFGSVFELSGDNHEIQNTVFYFNGDNGSAPLAGVFADQSGNIFGTTADGGINSDGVDPNSGFGTVFQVSDSSFANLVKFNNGINGNINNGAEPFNLVFDAEGTVYGTTAAGGQDGRGTLFALTGTNHDILTTLFNFNGTNGDFPMGGLVMDSVGNIYGTTAHGGSLGMGTLYELTGPNHETLNTLVNFNGANGSGPWGLVGDSVGNLYGTTYLGGENGAGVVFELSGSNHQTLTTLFNFTGNGSSAYNTSGPYDLAIDGADNLFVIMAGGGTYGAGGVLQLSGLNQGKETASSQSVTLNLDTIAPIITPLSQTSNNALATVAKAGDVITQSFTSTDTVTSVLIDGQAATVVRGLGDNYTATYTVQMGSTNGLAAANITAFDLAGNLCSVSLTGGVTIDTVDPVITLLGQTSNNALATVAKAGDVITQSFRSTDTVASVLINGQAASVVHDVGNTYTATYTVQTDSTNGLTTANITAYDLAGNLASVSLAGGVTIDTVAPVITLIGQTSSNTRASVAKAGDVITQSFTSTDAVTSVLIDGQAATVVHGLGDNYSATYTVQSDSVNGLADISITAKDLAGNSTTSTISGSVSVDTIAPIIHAITEVSSNARNNIARVGDQITESFTVSDVAEISVLINGQDVQVLPGATLFNGRVAYLSPAPELRDQYAATYAVTENSNNGSADVIITAQDLAGNVTTTHIIGSVTIDTIITPASISSAGGLTNVASQIITGTGEAWSTVTLLDSDSNLGTTTVNSDGTWSKAVTLIGQGEHAIIASTDGAWSLTTLVNFDRVNNGGSPYDGLIMDRVGNLYGTSMVGGPNPNGTVFELSGANHEILTTLVTFDGSNGRMPFGALVSDSSGNLYGTTRGGGIFESGTVFELSGAHHETFKTLVSFDGNNGAAPTASLISDDMGNLYGTTSSGGLFNHGTVFELSGANHEILTTLVNFDGNNGTGPQGSLHIDAGGNLYGTTAGVSFSGTVFKLSGVNHEILTTLVDFGGAKGALPVGGIISDIAGNLYGTTSTNGGRGLGTLFELSGSDHQTLTNLVNFWIDTGGFPRGNLTSDSYGNIYGTGVLGGTNGGAYSGTVYKLSGVNHDVLTTLVNFNGIDGSQPNGGLVIDPDGNIFGTTYNGGQFGWGTVFELSLQSIHSSEITYTLDTISPTITPTSQVSSNINNAVAKAGDVITESFTSTDAVTSVSINGQAATVVHGLGNNYTATYSVQSNAMNGLADVIITAQDLVGNTSSKTVVGLVTVDTVAPTVAILSTGGVTKISTQTITGTGEAGTTLTLLDGVSTLGTTVVNVDGTWSKLVALSNQSVHSITALNSDAAGNSSQSAAVLFDVETSSNHAPTVSAPLTSTSAVRTQAFWSNLLAGASDADTGDNLSVTGLTYTVNGGAPSGQAPSGIQLVNNQLLVDPNNTAFSNLSTGQSETIVASYTIADDHGGAVAQTNTIVIGGPAIDPMILNNHAPTVAAPLATTFSKGSQAFWSNLLSGAADVDARNTLNVTDLRFSVAGAAITAVAPTGIQFANNQLLVDPNSTAFKDLTLGQTETIVASYKISDGYGGAVAQTNSLTVTGLGATSAGSNPNSSPSLISVAAALQSTSTAGTQGFWSNLLAGATDSNPNAHLDVANLRFSVNNSAPTVITPVGIQYANKSIMVDPNNTAFRALATDQSKTIVASYDIVDGLGSSVAQTDTIIINGQGSHGDSSGGVNTPTPNNHAPEVSAPVTAQAGVHTSAFWSNMLAGATDSDVGNQLHVSNVLFSLNGGVAVSSAPTGIQVANDQLLVDPNSTAFNHLGVGQADTIVASYNVIDGHGGSVAQTDTVTISGPVATVANGTITGTANHDILLGTSGNDTFLVGAGADTITGGRGADVFKYTSLSNSPTSSTAPTTTITDFSTTDGDRVDVTAILNGTSTLNSTIHVNQTGTSNTSLSVTVGGVEYYIANVPNQAVSVPDAVANPASGATLTTALHGADWTTVVDVASSHGAPSSVTAAGTATVANATANPTGDWTAVVQAGAATVDTAQSQVTFAAAPTANAVSIQTADTTVHEVSNVTAVVWHL